MLLEFRQDSTLLQYYIIVSAIVVCKCTKNCEAALHFARYVVVYTWYHL